MSWDDLLEDTLAEFEAVDELLVSMTEEQWDLPTPAEGWNSRDQISHLTYFDDKAELAATDSAAFAEHFQSLADRGFDVVTQAYLDDGRSMSGDQLRERRKEARSRMIAAFSDLDPKDRLPWYGPEMSARSAVTARLMETWAHGYDVADTIGQTLPATDRLKSICHLGTATVGWSFINRGSNPPTDTITFILTSPSGAIWRWNDDRPDATDLIEGPALDFALLVTQRRSLESLGLSVSGSTARAYAEIAQCFAGPPT